MANLDYYGMFDHMTGDSDIYEYDSDEFSRMISFIVPNGVGEGCLEVLNTGGGLTLTVGSGWCFINGRWGGNDTIKTITLSAGGSGLVRYDRIVITLDTSTRKISLDVLEGTAGSTVPNITENQIALATVQVSNSSTVVTDEREFIYKAVYA